MNKEYTIKIYYHNGLMADWYIIRNDFIEKDFNEYTFNENAPDVPFGQYSFLGQEPIYLMCTTNCDQELLDEVKDIKAFEVMYDFQAFDMSNPKPIGEFKGTFMDAFKFINKNQGVYVY